MDENEYFYDSLIPKLIECERKEVYDDVERINIPGETNRYKRLQTFPSALNKVFPNLNSLKISWQSISTIRRKDMNGLENLHTFRIYDCELTTLPSNLFEHMKKLKIISFRGNKLEHVSSDLLKPIIGNELVLVDFRNNNNIDAYFFKEKIADRKRISLQRLMDMIDDQCNKPSLEYCIDKKFKTELADKFSQLWESKCGADFTIITNDSKKIPVHKTVLMVSSPVFSSMFEHEMKENTTGVLKIEAYDPEAVQHFFGFLYTGKIPGEEHAMELLALAALYEIPNLKSMCEDIIMKNTNNSNAYEVFTLAHLHLLDDLKKKTFALIQKMFPDRKLADALYEKPLILKELIEAKMVRKRKLEKIQSRSNNDMQEAEQEYEMAWKKNC